MSAVVAEPNAPLNPARPLFTGVSAWLAALRPDTALLPQDPNREIRSEAPVLQQVIAGIVQPEEGSPSVFPTVRVMNNRWPSALMRSYEGAALVESPMHRQVRYATHDIPTVQLSIRKSISPAVVQAWLQAQQSI